MSVAHPSRMTDEQYFAIAGLSHSGMKDLAVSALRFWHLHVNPNRPAKRETPEMTFGKALHCAVLEPDQFERRYCCDIDATDFPGCLCTMDDLRGWLRERGLPVSGSKDALIERVAASDPRTPIYALLEQRHEADSAGKVRLSKDDWARVQRAGNALMDEPAVRDLLSGGDAEVPMFAADPETGALLKGKMDWVRPDLTLDLKTFSQQRGKSIDKSITDAIYYERYFRQAYFYSLLRTLQTGASPKAPRFILAFVESDEPHEVRIRELRPKTFGEANLYWQRAAIEVRALINTYAECREKFGDQPWREVREIDPLLDEEMPQLAY